MRNMFQLVLALCFLQLDSQAANEEGFKHSILRHPQFLELSKSYSDNLVAKNPRLQALLNRLGYRYVHQLDPGKVYFINNQTLEIGLTEAGSVAPSQKEQGITTAAIFGFASVVNQISAPGSDIIGLAKTVVTCPFGAQTATVAGFMASTVSRDPIAGIRSGTLVVDNILDTVAEANFRILKVPGGAKNPINRTVMETTHTATCGDESIFQNVVATWPPLRLGMVIDDTGSMGEEIGGIKTALAEFIGSVNSDPAANQRGVSYEMVSFKDSPTLRLANTTDTAAALSAVGSLFASGGDDCPEDSLGALGAELSNLIGDEDSEGEIILVTDASPGPGNTGEVIALANSLGVRVNIMLSGDCVADTAATRAGVVEIASAIPSARVVFRQIAEETGGLFFYRPGGSIDDYRQILAEIFDSAFTGGDTTPPVVTVTATPNSLWPANHKMIKIQTKVIATDDKDPAPLVSLVGVTVNDPDDGQGDGKTVNDVVVDSAGQIYLRAERSALGKGRFYTITFQATDKNGNKGFGSVDVIVPHDNRKSR